MFRYQKADPEGNPRRTIHLRLAEEAIILLTSQGRGLSLPSEAACRLTLLHLRLRQCCPFLRDDHHIPTAAMASEKATGWSTTMRNSEHARMAWEATMTAVPVPSPLLRPLPRRWLENVLEWGPMTHMTAVRPLPLLRPTWSGTEAPSDEHPLHLLQQLVTGIPTSGPGSPRCLELRCMQRPAPGTPSQRERRCHLHLDMQVIRHTRA